MLRLFVFVAAALIGTAAQAGAYRMDFGAHNFADMYGGQPAPAPVVTGSVT